MNPDNTYPVPCIAGNIQREKTLFVSVPGSKSITNRALLLATLASGTSVLRGALFSDDSRHFLNCVQQLGFETTVDEEAKTVSVTGRGGGVPLKEASLYVGSAGTAARFLTAYLGLSDGVYQMDASEQMRKRPMAPLLDALKKLGCEIDCKEKEGFFPFVIRSHGFQDCEVTVNIDSSSQFLSALLIASCLAPRDFTLHVQGSHGMSYIDMTCRMMQQFGVRADHLVKDLPDCGAPVHTFRTAAGQRYGARDYLVEPDISAACYFYAMCPLLSVPVQVENVHFASLQGDVEFLRILERLGCTAEDLPEGIRLTPPSQKRYLGVCADMSSCSDQAITLAAIAPFADSPTTITGIGHIRLQESDRLMAIVTELEKTGIHCEYTDTSVTIYPGTPAPARIATYDDHRMAMGFSLIGLRSEGIVIENPSCCRKTFENYFDILEACIRQLRS